VSNLKAHVQRTFIKVGKGGERKGGAFLLLYFLHARKKRERGKDEKTVREPFCSTSGGREEEKEVDLSPRLIGSGGALH